jgi:hypothetical protein
MRLPGLILALTAAALCALAQQSPTINFNLVQVNHYHGQEQATGNVATPGERVVIDLGNPQAMQRFITESSSEINIAPVTINIERIVPDETGSVSLPWESQAVLHSVSGQDSFLVTSSRAGCPGTEVKPSVAVAFSTPRGWSYPPIRFGPLSAQAICPLGRGYQLDVSVKADGVPVVKLREDALQYGKR